MTKKKIIIFMPSIEDGGVEKNFFLVSNYLSKKIDDLSVITVSKNIKKKLNKKIKIITPGIRYIENIGRRKKFLICIFLLIKEIFLKKNIVVVSFQGNVYCALLCKLLFIKVIIRANTSPTGWSNNKIKNYLYKFLYGLADLIIVNSLEFKKEIKKRFNLKSSCIYNPINITEIKKLSNKKVKFNFFSDKTLNIIHIARLSEQKDLFCFLNSLKLIRDKIKIRALIIGNGKQLIDIKKFISANNLSKIIKMKSYIKNPFPYLKKSDVLVLSSKYEGLPNILLESLSLKKTVISSDCPTGPREILDYGKGGLLYKTGDARDLSDKILYFKKNKIKCIKKTLYGYKRLSRFEINLSLKKYFTIIKSF